MSRFEQLRIWYGALLNGVCIVAAVAVLATMLLVTANSFSRTFLGIPIPGTLEFTKGLLTVVIFFAMARTQFLGRHVKSAVLLDRLTRRLSWYLKLLSLAAGFVFASLATWAFWHFATQSYAFGELEMGAILYPLYPFKFATAFGSALLAIEYLLEIISTLGGNSDEIDEDELYR